MTRQLRIAAIGMLALCLQACGGSGDPTGLAADGDSTAQCAEAPTTATMTAEMLLTDDGLELPFNVFRPASVCSEAPVPIIVWHHGFPEARATQLEQVQMYLDAGFGFVSLGQRGVDPDVPGQTYGVPLPEVEVRDNQRLLDWVHDELDWVRKQADRGIDKDIVAGSFGNGGGAATALMVAALDGRIDAVIPYTGWHDLNDSLFPNGAIKSYWGLLFYTLCVTSGCEFHPEVDQWFAEVLLLNDASSFRERFDAGSPSSIPERLRTPTLLISPANDIIFSGLRGALRNFETLRDNAAPVWLVGTNSYFVDVLARLPVPPLPGLNLSPPLVDMLEPVNLFRQTAPDRTRVNQCAEVFAQDDFDTTPLFRGPGRLLGDEPGPLPIDFFRAYLHQDPAAQARMTAMPRLSLPVEQDGCVFAEDYPVADETLRVELGDQLLPQIAGATTLPLIEAIDSPVTVAGEPVLSFTISSPIINDVIVFASLFLEGNGARHYVMDQVLGLRVTPDQQGEALQFTVPPVFTTIAPGQTLSLRLEGANDQYFANAARGLPVATAAGLSIDLPLAQEDRIVRK